MTTAAAQTFWLDPQKSKAARTNLVGYTLQLGVMHSELLGITRAVPPPVNTLIGNLLVYLQNLPVCAQNSQEQVFWQASSFEAWLAMQSLIEKEWSQKKRLGNQFARGKAIFFQLEKIDTCR